MTSAQVIVLATPVFLALIALEWWVGRHRGRDTYRLHDAMTSIGLGMLSQLTGVLVLLAGFAAYDWAWRGLAAWRLPADAWWVWASGLVLYDFLYYWQHRAGHRVAVLWAAHAVHHQSEDYNLSTALRQTSTGWIFGWVFYVPMALAGYPPRVFAAVALVDLLYQYWVHTQQVGRLGWFDRVFCSPSNHRVHHAVNDEYLDRNYGGILILWDRLFGTFVEERDDLPCTYGTRQPLRSWNPLWANLQVYASLAHDARLPRRWRDKLFVWLKPPGWRPVDAAARDPKLPFDLARLQRYDPPAGRAARAASVVLFVASLAVTTSLLWRAHRLPMAELAAGILIVIAGLSAVARLGAARPLSGAVTQ
jgi:sterol desaturase/sphingolipid hydroxylase (fatty acid hydroxylase superfamily)